ncbi:uncharacterized protein LOC141641269 [Silene latifolia]|uniref:uncharacterized protein LOC141641269 n=1 Tax=Silene latifolia TaxID=37657 RepID=UPI003D77ED5A
MCRQYLWYGKDPKENPALVSWEKICRPRKQGGVLVLGTFIPGTLPLLELCIKSANWMDYEPRSGASWAWRKIYQVKNMFKNLLSTGEPYTAQKGYLFLKPLTDKVAWLVAQNRLLTQDRLVRMRILDTNSCEVCGVMAEDHIQLFFGCAFSKQCHILVQNLCNVLVPAQDCIQWWIKWRTHSATKKKIIGVILASLMYHLWQHRNACRIDKIVMKPVCLVQKVQQDVRARLQLLDLKCNSRSVLDWVKKL